ncbi:MAG: hypothetical protein ACPG7E_04240 [Marinirhabdus sp.]
MKKYFLLFTIASFLACDTTDGDGQELNCTTVFVNGLDIRVEDVTTGQPIGTGIQVIAQDGDHTDALSFTGSSYVGAGERPGTYTVTITSDSYTPYTSPPITVRKTDDGCHVVTQNRKVQLTPF